MSAATDAGCRALAGFFYQILASARYAVRVLHAGHSPRSASFEASVELECLGQDAASTETHLDQKRLELVQCKFSSDSPRHPIGTSELIRILRSFLESEREARRIGVDHLRFLLITNRPLTAGAQTLLSKAQNGQKHGPLDDVVQHKKRGKLVHRGRTKETNFGIRNIANGLNVDQRDHSNLVSELQEYAAGLGVLPQEFTESIDRIVGRIFYRSQLADRHVTLEELNTAIVAFNSPRRLSDDSVRELMLQQISQFANEASIDETLADRPAVMEIATDVEHALWILIGEGGVGKTTALKELILGMLRSTKSILYTSIKAAIHVDATWLSQTVAGWRHSTIASHSREPLALALQRLEVTAESGHRRLLVLGLDAIDEIDRRATGVGSIVDVLRFFVEEEERCCRDRVCPRAVLIATCRSADEFDNLINRSGLESRTVGRIVHLDFFTPVELTQLADVLPASSRQRVIKYVELTKLQQVQPFAMFNDYRNGDQVGETIDRSFAQAICHPIVWRFFSRLDEPLQNQTLDGDPAALAIIAQRFVDWACKKVGIRRCGIDAATARIALCAAAKAHSNSRMNGRYLDDWRDPTMKTSGLNDASSARLFREMESCGLIAKSSKTEWRWQHQFVCDFLHGLSAI